MRKLYIIIALIAAIILSGIGIYYISNINPIQNTTKNDISDSESSSTNKTIDTSEINKPGKFSTIVESEIKVADPKITVEDPVASIVASFNSESIANSAFTGADENIAGLKGIPGYDSQYWKAPFTQRFDI